MIRLKSVGFLDSIREPGGNHQATYFATEGGYGLAYDPATQLLHIVKGAASRSVHVSRAKEMELEPVAKTKAETPAKLATSGS